MPRSAKRMETSEMYILSMLIVGPGHKGSFFQLLILAHEFLMAKSNTPLNVVFLKALYDYRYVSLKLTSFYYVAKTYHSIFFALGLYAFSLCC